jgi:DNA processing protein
MSTLPQDAALTPAPLDEDRLAWLALTLSPGLGPKRILDAMRALDAPCQIFTLPLTSLEGLKFPAEAAQFVFEGKARAAAEQEWAQVAAQGATLVTFSCPEYARDGAMRGRAESRPVCGARQRDEQELVDAQHVD